MQSKKAKTVNDIMQRTSPDPRESISLLKYQITWTFYNRLVPIAKNSLSWLIIFVKKGYLESLFK